MDRPHTDVSLPAANLSGERKTAGAAALDLVPGADPYIAELVRQYHWALSQPADEVPADQSRRTPPPEWFPPVRKPH